MNTVSATGLAILGGVSRAWGQGRVVSYWGTFVGTVIWGRVSGAGANGFSIWSSCVCEAIGGALSNDCTCCARRICAAILIDISMGFVFLGLLGLGMELRLKELGIWK